MKIIWLNCEGDFVDFLSLKMMEYARSLGDALYVGMATDARFTIQEKKPLKIDQNTRFCLLESLKFVDKVFLYDTDYQIMEYMKEQKPFGIVASEKERGKYTIGEEYCDQIIYFPLMGALSGDTSYDKYGKKF